MASISQQTYTSTEETEINQWLTTSERLRANPAPSDAAPILDALNAHLASRTTLLGAKPSRADVAVYEALRPTVSGWTAEQRTGEKEGRPNIVRHLDFVQNRGELFGIKVGEADKVVVNPEEILYVKPPVDAKAEKERLKKEKAAAAAAAAGGQGQTGAEGGEKKSLVDRTREVADKAKHAVATAMGGGAVAEAVDSTTTASEEGAKKQQQKKEKKEKAPKQQKPAPQAAQPPSVGLIDLRVGHILKAIKHPEADSLFVSTIAMGDPAGTPDTDEHDGQVCRTVCSGLNGLVPLEEMQGRKVVVVANLKPVKMRGIKSCAMVLAASPRPVEGVEDDGHKGPVELVSPPEGSKAGEPVFFQGWRAEPEKQLNPKKKVWETFQPGFTTTDSLEVGFDAAAVKETGKDGLGKLVTEAGGVCTVPSLTNAVVR